MARPLARCSSKISILALPGSNIFDLTAIGSTLFFRATDNTNGAELWKSNGTAAGTILVKDINPGSANASPYSLTVMGGTLFFGASDNANGAELWKSDGTTAGTLLVKDINPWLVWLVAHQPERGGWQAAL